MESPRPDSVVDLAAVSVETNYNVEQMGIPRDDRADTWNGHNKN